MIYEFYNINPRNLEKVGVTQSFNIGLNKYMNNIIDLIDEEDAKNKRKQTGQNFKLGLKVRTDLKKLKDEDCFLVCITARDKLYTLGIHVMNDTNEGKDTSHHQKIREIYNDFQKELEEI